MEGNETLHHPRQSVGSRQGLGAQATPGREESALCKYPSVQNSKETSDLTQKPVPPRDPRGGPYPQSYLGGLGPSEPPGLSHLEGTLLPPSPPPSSPSTGAERKVDPFAKYAKKEGRWFSLRKTQAEREPVLPVPTKMGSEIIRTSDLAGLR